MPLKDVQLALLMSLSLGLLSVQSLLILTFNSLGHTSNCNNLDQRGYVFGSVCLSVSRIMEKLLAQFSWNLVEDWSMGHGRTHYVLERTKGEYTNSFLFLTLRDRAFDLVGQTCRVNTEWAEERVNLSDYCNYLMINTYFYSYIFFFFRSNLIKVE